MRGNRAGFTLLEMVIVMTIMSIVMGVVVLSQKSTQGLMSQTSTSGLLEEKALKALEAVAFEARWSDSGSFLITQENSSDRLDLQLPVDFVSGTPVWSTPVTYRVEPSTIDADENGVMNEGRFVRIQDGVTRVLSDYVVLGGFSATMTDENVVLQLSLAKRDGTSDGLLTANAQTSISVRN